MKRHELIAAIAAMLLTACGAPAPAPAEAPVGASSSSAGGGSVAFSSATPGEAPADYWMLDAKKEE